MKQPKVKHSLKKKKKWDHNAKVGFAFVTPAILGFMMFCALPICYSAYLSFTDWNIFKEPSFVGFQNYIKIFTGDYLFRESMKATFSFAIGSTICSTVYAFMIALLLSLKVKGISVHRTIFYLPSVVPSVAMCVLWGWLYNKDFGLFNALLGMVGISKQPFLSGQNTVIPSLVFMAMWSCGNMMIIYLAGIQGVSDSLLEAVRIDGGSYRHELFHVIVPMVSPVIFFNVLMSLINSFQAFNQAFMMTGGGPNNKSLFFSYYLYSVAFQQNKMGYACALGWIMFLIMILFSAVFFKVFTKHLFFEGSENQ